MKLNYWNFLRRFCRYEISDFGLKVTGNRNVAELKAIFATYVLRKWQEDVLADLPSDAYATAFAVLILRKAGLSADEDQITRGLAWLRQDQRESGRWFVRSPKRDGKHFISHAATMFSLMAFRSCGERPSKPEQLR